MMINIYIYSSSTVGSFKDGDHDPKPSENSFLQEAMLYGPRRS